MIKALSKTFFLIATSYLLLSSCHPIFCKWSIGYKQMEQLPGIDSIIGTYSLTSASVKYLRDKGFTGDCKLILKDSNSYTIINAPNIIFNDTRVYDGQIKDINGQWFSSCMDYGCMIELEGIVVAPFARKNNGPISITISISDPDFCEGIIFERQDK